MIIIISLVAGLIVGIIIIKHDSYISDTLEFIGAVLTFVSVVSLIILGLALIFNPLDVKSNIATLEATRQTVQSARELGNNYENVMLQKEIIECNQWLAKTKWENNNIWGIWIPDCIEDVEPIK